MTKGRATGSGKAVRKVVRKAVRPLKPEPKVAIRVRDLDPQAMCGEGTSVARLIRVDQVIDRALEAHLVYFDRHGWYCEHGVTCPAVSHARRYAKQVRSEYAGNATHNGRMRA